MDIEKHSRAEKGGFTLIELLVVVAIIAILAAMLMPALQQARARARTAVCINNLKNMGVVINMYLDDWEDYFFHCSSPLWPTTLINNGYIRNEPRVIKPSGASVYPELNCPASRGSTNVDFSYNANLWFSVRRRSRLGAGRAPTIGGGNRFSGRPMMFGHWRTTILGHGGQRRDRMLFHTAIRALP